MIPRQEEEQEAGPTSCWFSLGLRLYPISCRVCQIENREKRTELHKERLLDFQQPLYVRISLDMDDFSDDLISCIFSTEHDHRRTTAGVGASPAEP